MKVIREWKDNGDREEVSLEYLRGKLEENAIDPELAFEEMKQGNRFGTAFAVYFLELEEGEEVSK